MSEILNLGEELYYVSLISGAIVVGFSLLCGYLFVKMLESLKENE